MLLLKSRLLQTYWSLQHCLIPIKKLFLSNYQTTCSRVLKRTAIAQLVKVPPRWKTKFNSCVHNIASLGSIFSQMNLAYLQASSLIDYNKLTVKHNCIYCIVVFCHMFRPKGSLILLISRLQRHKGMSVINTA